VTASGTRQVVVLEDGSVALEEHPLAPLGPGDALVRFVLSGVCGSDVHAAHGRHPWVPRPYRPGHELVGIVEELGSAAGDGAGSSAGGARVRVGDRVAVEPIHACGDCKYCRDGRYNLCATMAFFGCTTPLGGMADRFVLPAKLLIPLPAGLSDEEAALVEPLSTPVHAVNLAGGDLQGRTVAILGAGTIGLLVLAVVKARGAAKVVVTDPLPTKRSLALELGADEVFDATDPGVVAAVRASLGTSADIVFDCVAVQATMDQAIAMAIKGGTVVVVGVPSRPVTVPLPEIQDLQIRIQGSATYVRSDIETAIGMLAAHAVPADRIVTAAYPLSRAGEAFAAASDGSNVKVIVRAEG
jgi:2-desacetyl-2-hydroxyethyl bacteriochlorophyllide A dehydrogenase